MKRRRCDPGSHKRGAAFPGLDGRRAAIAAFLPSVLGHCNVIFKCTAGKKIADRKMKDRKMADRKVKKSLEDFDLAFWHFSVRHFSVFHFSVRHFSAR
jgi:hypothetical protein